MAKVEVMENGTVLDTINADLVEKSGKRMYLIKRYKGRQDILKVFHADKAVYTYVKGKGAYKIYVDHETLEQLSPKEAFIDKRLPPRLQTLNEEASDVMAAHKEAAKRIKENSVVLAQLVGWIAMIIIAILLFITFYMWWSTPHTIVIHCDNCGSVITGAINASKAAIP